ncbi:unnamed protein product [Darwinula stevensoni]|uniref:Acyl-CoA-binding domain-containing protein 6 n=1 Tax=Darwinula stevensoni TaxID=69355 RepID=A0A7R9A4G4_9CRUS|nr:unnamed protein product [Darwinula stevensoni]CAG0883306.1 unnamed protein product [Darwinula stevensoni]
MEDLKKEFEKAAAYIRAVALKLDTKDLTYLYARYKQAQEGPCNIAKPGFFDFQGKIKWEAWKELGEMDGMRAMEEYVAHVSMIAPEWQESSGDTSTTTHNMGVSVSRPAVVDIDIPDSVKTVFDWVKDGNLDALKAYKDEEFQVTDEEGMSPIHWASDRGFPNIVQYLIERGCDPNSRDGEKQTPLHYACSCGHKDVVIVLLKSGADRTLRDLDDLSPVDVANEEDVLSLLKA